MDEHRDEAEIPTLDDTPFSPFTDQDDDDDGPDGDPLMVRKKTPVKPQPKRAVIKRARKPRKPKAKGQG